MAAAAYQYQMEKAAEYKKEKEQQIEPVVEVFASDTSKDFYDGKGRHVNLLM
jgi:hypothetical protein